MGFWGKLGRIVGHVAAPFTFGLSEVPAAIYDISHKNWGGLVGDVLGGVTGGFGGGASGALANGFKSAGTNYLKNLGVNSVGGVAKRAGTSYLDSLLGGGGGMNLSSLVSGDNPMGTGSWTDILTGGSGGGGSTWQKILGNILTGQGKAGQVAGTAGDVASGIEKGRAADRASQNDFNVLQDRTRLQAQQDFENALENRAALELKQKTEGQSYQGNAYHQAMLGALGKNIQDVTLGGVPGDVPVVQFKGGLRPSAMGPEGRAAAALLNQKAMSDLQNGMQLSSLPEIERFKPSDYKKGNYLDTILGTVGTVGKAGDIWNERTQKGKDQSYIDTIRQEIQAQEKERQDAIAKGKQPPPQQPGGMVMVDPTTGKPVFPDQGDNTNPFGGGQAQAPQIDPLTGRPILTPAVL